METVRERGLARPNVTALHLLFGNSSEVCNPSKLGPGFVEERAPASTVAPPETVPACWGNRGRTSRCVPYVIGGVQAQPTEAPEEVRPTRRKGSGLDCCGLREERAVACIDHGMNEQPMARDLGVFA